jgi:hypothetical protein
LRHVRQKFLQIAVGAADQEHVPGRAGANLADDLDLAGDVDQGAGVKCAARH